jgi:hypothetical protein
MVLEASAAQKLVFDAHMGVKKTVTIELDRLGALEAWAMLDEDRRGQRPIVRLDLDAVAREHGVKPADLLAALRKDALFRAREARGELRVA